MKACAYEPKERYASAKEMRMELEALVWKRRSEENKHFFEEETVLLPEKTEETVALDINEATELLEATVGEATGETAETVTSEAPELINQKIAQTPQKAVVRKSKEHGKKHILFSVAVMIAAAAMCVIVAVLGVQSSFFETYECGDIEIRIPENQVVKARTSTLRESSYMSRMYKRSADINKILKDRKVFNYTRIILEGRNGLSSLRASYLEKDPNPDFEMFFDGIADGYNKASYIFISSIMLSDFGECELRTAYDSEDNPIAIHASFEYDDKIYWFAMEGRAVDEKKFIRIFRRIKISDEKVAAEDPNQQDGIDQPQYDDIDQLINDLQ